LEEKCQASYRFESSRSHSAKACKRKGGWKFHDLSDEGDGFGKKKRAYGQNKLENEILQVINCAFCFKMAKQKYSCIVFGIGAYLFVKAPRPKDDKGTFSVFRVKLPPVTTSLNQSKVEEVPLSALPKDTTNIFAGLSLFYAERQAGKL